MKIKTMKIKTLAIAAILAGGLFPGFAMAAADRYQVSRTVDFADLDLSSARGVKRLDQRIAFAVRQACGRVDARALQQVADIARCRREAATTATQGRALAMASSRRSGVAMLTVGDMRIKN